MRWLKWLYGRPVINKVAFVFSNMNEYVFHYNGYRISINLFIDNDAKTSAVIMKTCPCN